MRLVGRGSPGRSHLDGGWDSPELRSCSRAGFTATRRGSSYSPANVASWRGCSFLTSRVSLSQPRAAGAFGCYIALMKLVIAALLVGLAVNTAALAQYSLDAKGNATNA